jgi:hypothetical protein
LTAHREIAPAKLNLALHVRGKLADGRHAIETIFAFCTDGDRLSAEPAEDILLQATGPFAAELPQDNLVLRAARALQERRRSNRARKASAGCIGDRRRVGRCCGRAALADVTVAHRSFVCTRCCAKTRQRRSCLSAEPDGTR